MGDPGLIALACCVVSVVVALGVAYSWGHSAAESKADSDLALLGHKLDMAKDAIEVLQADASRQNFASAALVQAHRAIGDARAVADPRLRRRMLLSAGSPAPPSPGPTPSDGTAPGPVVGLQGPAGPGPVG